MYEIKENRRELFDGTEITTYTRDVVSANILQVEAGTTGYKGGDTGHGGRTYFRISDEASTDIMSGLLWTDSAATVLKLPSAATANWKL